MSFLALLFAALFEQIYPLRHNFISDGVITLARRWHTRFYSEKKDFSRTGFVLLMLMLWLPSVAVLGVLWLFISPVYIFVICVLFYFLIEFRVHQKSFSKVRDALFSGDIEEAKNAAKNAGFLKTDNEADLVEEVVRQNLVTVQKGFFNIFFWGMIPYVGIPMVLLCWLNQKIVTSWQEQQESKGYKLAYSVLCVVSWVPSRFGGFLLALLGNFEIALYNQSQQKNHKGYDFFQTTGIGALGILEVETPNAKGDCDHEAGHDSNTNKPLPAHRNWDIAAVRSVAGLLLRSALGLGVIGLLLFLLSM